LSHSFEQERPDHKIHKMNIPQGHAHSDQKYGKGMRSPMVGQLPMDNGLESPESDSGSGGGY